MVRKEGKYYRVQISRGGVKHSTTFPTRKEAQAFESAIIEEWKHNRTGGIKRYTLSNAIIKWAEEELPRQKARRTTAQHAKAIIPYTTNRTIEEIPAVWSEYKRDSQHLKPATVNRKGAILRRIANLAYKEWKWLHTPVFITLLAENNKRKFYLTKLEMLHLVDCCRCYETKLLIKILYYTGMRIGEVLNATPTDGVLVVPDTKNGQPAFIPMHREIERYWHVFPFKYKYHYYYDRFCEARELAGRPELHIHDIRHSTASALLKSGASMVEVRDTLRHASLQTTNRYLHLSNESVTNAINRL